MPIQPIASTSELQEITSKLVPVTKQSSEVVTSIVAAAQCWLTTPIYLAAAAQEASVVTGFSRELLVHAYTSILKSITKDSLELLLTNEFSSATKAKAVGPELLFQVVSGNVPAVSIQAIIYGLLLNTKNLIRVSKGDTVSAAAFLASLNEVDPVLAKSVGLVHFESVERSLLLKYCINKASAVVVYGSDETIRKIQHYVRYPKKFKGYGHRVSFGIVGYNWDYESTIVGAAHDVAMYDQQGCMSPHCFYVMHNASRFAKELASELGRLESRLPRGVLSSNEAANFSTQFLQTSFQATASENVEVYFPVRGSKLPSYVVVFEKDRILTESPLEFISTFPNSPLNRFVYVNEVNSVDEVVKTVSHLKGLIATIGVGGTFITDTSKIENLRPHRICKVGEMQNPPIYSHHDGQHPLSDLVDWIDIET